MNINELQLVIDFYKQGNSIAATCRNFHLTSNTLKKILTSQNVHIRSQHEQVILENIKRTNPINHTFFSVLTDESAYYLGFIAADGTVRKHRNEIKIGLSIADKLFLEEFKQRIKSENKIKTYVTTNGFECCEFSFSSLQIKLDLLKYGVVPNKTYIGLDLNLIPEPFQLAFIKGFFDGDGSFTYNKNTKQAKVSFTSHTVGILKNIQNFFNDGSIYQDKRTKVYSLEFSTLPSLKIMEQFYKINSPYLQRKKDKYDECLLLRNNIPRDKDSLEKDEKIC